MTKRPYSEEFKIEAVKQIMERGYYGVGEWDFVLLFLVRSMDQCVEHTRELFFASGNVKSFNTLVALRRVKTGSTVPVDTA